MEDQKLENLLNLALDASEREREKSLELSIGYDQEEKTWEVIVKYTGSLDVLREQGIEVVELLNGYAILNLRESQLEGLTQVETIEYIEKPKRLFFAIEQARAASCIDEVQLRRGGLSGVGCIVAVIDSGIDYLHPDFRKEDGSTRILFLWDQTISGNPPTGYAMGTEYTAEEINRAIEAGNNAYGIVKSRDLSGHGTAVAGIAAGNGRASEGRYRGVATESPLIIVKLGNPREESFPRTTELMQALDYCIRKSLELNLPISINLSFGNTYGSHDGTSLLEAYIDGIANVGRNCICIGTGNEGASGGHTSGVLQENVETIIELAVDQYETSFGLQIWKSYVDEVDIGIESPDGVRVGPLQQRLGVQRFSLEDTELLLYYGEPSPYSTAQEIYIDFLPKGSYVNPGIWRIILTPQKIVKGNYDLWLPSQGVLSFGTRFLLPTPETTLTIPSTARRGIAVGAYNSYLNSYADFSGRGIPGEYRGNKPDLAAPGVNINCPLPGGGYMLRSGTSMATPFVTGSAALLMEWGIVKKNDPFLYGEKVKAYLTKGARPLPGFQEFPNDMVGWGTLCVADSIPRG
ncbi:MAG: S8 family serine peptidase [Lachnospiraceae bacterium]|nr:S8 family serine peptidase [Lachnospiraceae bacterium]